MMRYLFIAVLLVLALPAGAQMFSVPECEEDARKTDTAVQKHLTLSNPTSDDEGNTMETISGFEDFCVKPYMCPEYEPRWVELRGENFFSAHQYEGKPTFFSDSFAELTAACGRE